MQPSTSHIEDWPSPTELTFGALRSQVIRSHKSFCLVLFELLLVGHSLFSTICEKPKTHREAICRYSGWQSQLNSEPTSSASHGSELSQMSSPVRPSDGRSPSHHLTATTWETLRENHPAEHSQSTESGKIIINGSTNPLILVAICYGAVGN